MLEAERDRLVKFVRDHEVYMQGEFVVNAISIKREIDEIQEAQRRRKREQK